ncbi:MAG: 7-cyano-7-deazaguanine synthase [Clostridia bacterium]|nr:7-cyano-7-deazaguanine synthase [Clostridia bacterium]
MNDMILILNSSDEFSAEVARSLRAEQIYCVIVPECTTAQEIGRMAPRGVILCGEADAAQESEIDETVARLGIPVLAIGHTAHALLACLGGASAGEALCERKAMVEYGRSALFTGISGGERLLKSAKTLMLPTGVEQTAWAGGCTIAFEDAEKKLYGVQFELERNDLEGSTMLMNFARDICGCSGWWSLDAALEKAQDMLCEAAARGDHAVCAVSGGVDSTLCALLAHKAFGERMTAIFVDTGLMREGEADGVQALFEGLGIPLLRVDYSGEILSMLAHKRGMEEKREVVVSCMYQEMLRQSAAIAGGKTLVLGTNYSDFLSSGSGAAMWRASGMTVVEPLMELFKDEVRAIARRLNMSEELVGRKPFPALGLGARIVGEVTAQRLHAMRTAEGIFSDEIRQAGLDKRLYKYFPVLIGGENLGSEMLVLRAVMLSGSQLMPARLPYDLVERAVQRILGELPGIVRVLYDQTPTALASESFS